MVQKARYLECRHKILFANFIAANRGHCEAEAVVDGSDFFEKQICTTIYGVQ